MERHVSPVVIIIQARMLATRLPGKVLKEVDGKPLLAYLLERLRRVRNADGLLVATSQNPEDQKIVAFCDKEGVPVFRGSEEDVLSRYLGAARNCGAATVVRITADCPLIDPAVVERVIAYYRDHEVDYAGNTLTLTYPRGMDTEVFSLRALEEAAQRAHLPSEREHVTLFMYTHPELFRLANVPYFNDMSKYRLTVDTQEDFNLVKSVLQELYPRNPNFTLEDILRYLEKNPEIARINAHVRQKPIEET